MLMKKTMVYIVITVFVLLSFTACEKEDPDNVGTNEISFGSFEFQLPDYYDPEPVEQTEDTAVYMRPKEKDMLQLTFKRISPYNDVWNRSNEMVLLQATLDALDLDNVDSFGKDDLKFSGEKDGVEVKGEIDSLYVSSDSTWAEVDESELVIVTILYKKDQVSEYEYSIDYIHLLSDATVDGNVGVYNMTDDDLNDVNVDTDDTNANSNGWDTDNNGEADWHDVDTNNDGDVSQDEMNDYLDDWEKEMDDQ